MKQRLIIRLILILALSSPLCLAQSAGGEMKLFEKDGLSFSYPSDWMLTDKSNAQAQHLILSQPQSSVLIMVIAYRELMPSREQFQVALENTTTPYIESIARNFAASGREVERDYPCMEMGGKKVSGVRIRGLYQNEPSAGAVYALAKARRFVNLVYIRADKDAPRGDIAWEAVHRTLKIESPEAPASDSSANDIVSGGFLNSKAVSLPRPEFSSFARGARASGTVVVKITVDEKGDVVSAKAITGHPLLHKAAEEAALRAKFTPTIVCGQPVKVTGTISYNFVYSSPGSRL
jgi:TonB family protein